MPKRATVYEANVGRWVGVAFLAENASRDEAQAAVDAYQTAWEQGWNECQASIIAVWQARAGDGRTYTAADVVRLITGSQT